MGAKTYDEYKSELEFNLGGHDNLSSYSGGWINSSYLDFCAKNKFWHYRRPKDFFLPGLDTTDEQATSDGQAYIYKPRDVNGNISFLFGHTLWDKTNDKWLEYMTHPEYIKKTGRADTDAENKPRKWTDYGNKIFLYPTPDDAYTIVIYFRKIPVALSAGADVTQIGREWDEPILELATTRSMLRLKMYDEAKIWKEEWIDMMKDRLGTQDKHKKRIQEYIRVSNAYKDFKY